MRDASIAAVASFEKLRVPGFAVGGLWGGMEGIRNSRLAGSTGKIRAATVLNGVTKQGTRAAVSLGAMGARISSMHVPRVAA